MQKSWSSASVDLDRPGVSERLPGGRPRGQWAGRDGQSRPILRNLCGLRLTVPGRGALLRQCTGIVSGAAVLAAVAAGRGRVLAGEGLAECLLAGVAHLHGDVQDRVVGVAEELRGAVGAQS